MEGPAMSILLYGHKNYRGTCVKINSDQSDLQNTDLNYRSSSAQLTSDNDCALFFTERNWIGDVIFRVGRKNIRDLRNPDYGGMPNFNNAIKSIRVSPFTLKVKYHFIWIPGDLPGFHSGFGGIASLVQQIKDMHEIVKDIWSKYLINLEIDPVIEQYENSKYFIMNDDDPNELQALKNDKTFNFLNSAINVVLVEDITGATGQSKRADLFEPVVIVKVRPTRKLFDNARTIAHEIGHTFGLKHGKNTNDNRLMTQTAEIDGDIHNAVHLETDEVETVHRNLATNDILFSKSLRVERP